MKTAIYIGGFCPLHKGHMDIIMRAKKENDHLYLIVYGYNEEERGKELGADAKARYYIIKSWFYGDDTITVLPAIYENKPDWELLLKDAMFMTSTTKRNVMFYTGEPVYHSFLVAHGFNCVYARTAQYTSASTIRKNPLAHWDKIVFPFRRFLRKTIVLSGASCEGKSICGKDLMRYFNCEVGYVEEYSKVWARRHNIKLENCSKDIIKCFIEGQYQYIKMSPECRILVSDGDAITNLSYAKLLLKEEEYKSLKEYARHLYNGLITKAFVFEPHKTFKDDGIRSMAAPFEVREQTFLTQCELYSEFGIDYEVLDGSYYENFCRIRDFIINNE